MGKYEMLKNLDCFIKDVYGVLLCIKRYPIYLKMRSNLSKNNDFRNKRENKRCYILGLGPSLKDVDLKKLQDGDVFAMNRFYRLSNAQEVVPKYYLMMDPAFYDLNGPYGQAIERAMQTFPNTIFLLNGRYRNKVANREKCAWILSWRGPRSLNKKADITRVTPSILNVVGYSIYTAIFMGYEEIILLGCDFNHFASQKMVHCYGTEERTATLFQDLFGSAFAIDEFARLAENARKQGIRIINATKGSLIDVFDRPSEYVERYLKPPTEQDV